MPLHFVVSWVDCGGSRLVSCPVCGFGTGVFLWGSWACCVDPIRVLTSPIRLFGSAFAFRAFVPIATGYARSEQVLSSRPAPLGPVPCAWLVVVSTADIVFTVRGTFPYVPGN